MLELVMCLVFSARKYRFLSWIVSYLLEHVTAMQPVGFVQLMLVFACVNFCRSSDALC